MTTNVSTMAEAANQFLQSLSPEARLDQQQEVLRFVRWYGTEQPLNDLGLRQIETYQTQVEATGADVALRLAPLRNFLRYLEAQGYLAENLAKHIKVRRSTLSRRAARGSELPQTEAVQLTPEGFQQLKDELDHLTTVVRHQISAQILEARRDKDIRENAPYHMAKDQQGLTEARIRELEHLLSAAEIIGQRSSSSFAGRIGIGSTVVVRDLDYEDEVRYTLVSPSEANPREGKLSVASPVGRALLDNVAGAEVEVEAPAGKVRYRIEKVER
ncbi:MAG: transcription elongation factor GreA [Chloroflexota bacterium]